MGFRRELANALRFLSIDAVEKAQSGHPGMPMGMADIAEVLWRDHLQHSPEHPQWLNRDRFVLSNGHGSMLLYSLLHLTGYALSIDDLKAFRQHHSKTPGHPEYGLTAGVETTTGPLGQGLANAVGMALAEKILAHTFNRDGFPIVDHYTWVFVGDGCLMEGISHEACSIAGTWGLAKLIVFYDDNGISIDGVVDGWFTDNTAERFAAYGWQVIPNVNGHDSSEIATAIATAKKESTRPTLICCKTQIGFGAPNKQGSHEVHGAPLGTAEIAAARAQLQWPHAAFEIPDTIYAAWDARAAGRARQAQWNYLFTAYQARYPDLASELLRRQSGQLPAQWTAHLEQYLQQLSTQHTQMATRKASQQALAAYATVLPELIGGSADLTPSNLTQWPGASAYQVEQEARYLHFGVREFAMSAIVNGLTVHGGFKAFGATFLVFSDYARNALRMAALMAIPSIFVFTHDSIGVGEDGPTHQPIEQLASLRLIPNMALWRPCDPLETAVAWAQALSARTHPTSLVLSRQTLATIDRHGFDQRAIERGGYILKDSQEPQAVLIATGSEVALALQAQTLLQQEGVSVRVVSLPCTYAFDRQEQAYQDAVLPPHLPRIAIEAGVSDYWRRYVGLAGDVMGIDQFGASAPASKLFDELGFTAKQLCDRTLSVIEFNASSHPKIN